MKRLALFALIAAAFAMNIQAATVGSNDDNNKKRKNVTGQQVVPVQGNQMNVQEVPNTATSTTGNTIAAPRNNKASKTRGNRFNDHSGNNQTNEATFETGFGNDAMNNAVTPTQPAKTKDVKKPAIIKTSPDANVKVNKRIAPAKPVQNTAGTVNKEATPDVQ
ncbi:MAG: hypothetical protein J5814_03830 [Bacteroidaceae bacterium]|nr:hypothetical protein [Bacteroidaceae bacterium]